MCGVGEGEDIQGPAWNISQRHSSVEGDVYKNAYHSIVFVIVKKIKNMTINRETKP